MKKIIVSLFTIAIVASVVVGATRAYFSDTEVSSNNIIQTGTVDIDIDGQNFWTGKFDWENIEPGDTKVITFAIHNVGTYPIKLWKIIKNLTTEENGIVEPEQDWYSTNNGGQSKNDIDTAIVYEMSVGGQIAIEKEAGITLDKIKDYYMGLVKLDPGASSAYNGILNPGGSVTVVQRYHFKEGTDNWAQSDKMTFDIEILAQQVSAPEPVKQLSFMNNKYVAGDWHVVADEKVGLLKYDSTALMFNYDFTGVGLNPATQYCLIYSKDPWSGGKKILIKKGMSDVNGKVSLVGSMDTGNLPYADDGNYPTGAKIWSLPCADYNEGGQSIGWPPHNDWLFENWPGFIKYTKGEVSEELPDSPPVGGSQTIAINELGGDISNQYGYQFGGYPTANVTFAYNSPANDRLSGTINATGLKPYATYQVKFVGKPTCAGAGGNNTANEYIGYSGRWTCIGGTTCTGSSSDKNRSDAQYVVNKAKLDSDPTKECVAGYLVWDFFTADSSGGVSKAVQTANSYHVLWSGGGICNTSTNTYLANLDPAHPTVLFSPANKVDGQIERGTCNGLTLNPGVYDLSMSITEESFHQGNWATVLMKDINFEIQ
ncbi:MAG: TasA family protein [bacterium]|nr:TasA family protein [bacterium]